MADLTRMDAFLNLLPTGLRSPLRHLFQSGTALKVDIEGDVEGNVTGNVTGNLSGNVTGNVSGTVTSLSTVSAEHGVGSVGTGIEPATRRGTLEDGTILTEIQIDLTGLKCKGTAENDVIGNAGAAFIGKYDTALYGYVYRVEVICLETPNAGSGTITADIDVAYNASALLEYDGEGGADKFNVGGVAISTSYSTNTTTGLDDDDYIYLVEGDTAATDGVYDAGQLLIRFFGRPKLS